MIRATLIAAALLTAAPAFAENAPAMRYQMEVGIVRNGVPLVSSRSLVAVDTPTKATLRVGDETYQFDARLASTEGQNGLILLQSRISRDGVELAAPRMGFGPTDPMTIEVGDEQGDLMRVSVTLAEPVTD